MNIDRLRRVLTKLRDVGLRGKRKKFMFLATSVDYLGVKVDVKGIHPLPEKVRAIKEAPTLWNVVELKSFLGLLSYYSRCLPSMSTLLVAPLAYVTETKRGMDLGSLLRRPLKRRRPATSCARMRKIIA